MRILLINKNHYVKSGVERAYFDMAEILEAHGHEVAFFSMNDPKNEPTKWSKYFVEGVDYNAENLSLWKKIRMAQRIIFNFQAYKNLDKLIEDFKPDVAHMHNIYHQLSPSVIYALKKHNIPTVLTLHDYRIISTNYNLFLRGKIWEKKNILAGIKDRCVKDSYLKSSLGAVEKIFHDILGSYGKINVFISPSMFLMNKFREFGFGGKIEYIPNPLNDLFYSAEAPYDAAGPLVYYSRLSKEKGVDVAIRAMEFLPEEKLHIIGAGPEKENLMALAKELGVEKRIFFFGQKKIDELKEMLNEAKAILVPSIWYENMPYAVVEPLAMRKIVIASRIGGIPDLIRDGENGFLFKVGDSLDLSKKIKELCKYDLARIKDKAGEGVAGCNREKYYENIMKIYQKLLMRKEKSA